MNIIILFLAAATSFLLVYYSIPMIIRIANNNHLFDVPDNVRKVHITKTPNLGGVSIFLSIMLSYLCWGFAFDADVKIHFLTLALIILFFNGIRDDLNNIKPWQKILFQALAGALIIFAADLRVTSFYGIMGFYELPFWFSVIFTFFLLIVIINSFNLVDGIDGLAGGLAAIISMTYAVWFYLIHEHTLCLICTLHASALVAFLRFNFSKNPKLKIFMGDCGSMIVGGIIAISTIRFLETGHSNPYIFLSATPSIAIAILIIPLFDTLRVFVIRIAKGSSPFAADRNHLHHLFLNLGLTHRTASTIMYGVNTGYIIVAFLMRNLFPVSHLLMIFFSGLFVLNILPVIVKLIIHKKMAQTDDLKMENGKLKMEMESAELTIDS